MLLRKSTALLRVIIFILTPLFSGTGCQSVYKLCRAEPAPLTGFLPDQARLREMGPAFPFQKMWFNPGVDRKKYDQLMLRRVNRKYVLDQNVWQNLHEAEAFQNRAQECDYIAAYLEESFKAAVRADPRRRFQLVNQPGPRTLVLELALVQVVPTKSALTAIEIVAGFLVPGLGLLTIFNSGEIAIEGKLTEARGGRLVGMFADRAKDRAALINLAGFTWYKNSENNIDEWSAKLVEILATRRYQEVETRCPLTLIEW